MVVAFTSNIGLAKPDESEVAKNWVESQKLAEDNNLIIIDKADFQPQLYTPTLIGLTTNPNVGAGDVNGEFIEFEGWIFGNFEIIFNTPGIVVGTGAGGYGVSLPALPDATFHTTATVLSQLPGTASCIGEGHIIDNTVALGGTTAIDLAVIGGTAYARMILETFPGKTAAWWSPGMPMTVDNNDRMSGNFIYKKA